MDIIITGPSSPTGIPVASSGRGPAGKGDGNDVKMLKPRYLDALDGCDFDNLL